MAPEQVEGGNVDGRADIYSLGVVMFEMATGRRPFQAPSVISLAYKQMNEPVPDPLESCPDLSPRLAAIITRCMAKRPTDRFDSASRIAEMLDA
jgi:serine/threonine-protein kinase